MNSLDGMRLGINAVPLLSPLTGVGQYTYRLITELRQLLQLQPWLFYGTCWDQELRTAAAPGVQEVHRTLRRLVPHSYMVSRLVRQMIFSTGVRKHRIDLYHEPAFTAYRFRGPSVVTVHDLSWVRHPETHPAERVQAMNWIMPKVVKHASHIVVDSEFVRQEVISYYGVPESRITTVLLGTSPGFQPLDKRQCEATLTQFGLHYGQYLLAVGTLEPRKNLNTVIAAYARLPDQVRCRYPLVIVGMNGWGMEHFSASLRTMLSRGEVRLTGYVPQEQLPALYAGARVFVYPSLYEGFGLPPLEAMASGVPVIASRRASLPEVVGAAGVLVEPLDDQAIAQHMQSLIDDHTLHGTLSAAGLERAQTFTWRKCALEMMAVYRKAIA